MLEALALTSSLSIYLRLAFYGFLFPYFYLYSYLSVSVHIYVIIYLSIYHLAICLQIIYVAETVGALPPPDTRLPLGFPLPASAILYPKAFSGDKSLHRRRIK